MSKLPLMDGILPLMDGVKERGVMAKRSLTQQVHSVQFRFRVMRTSLSRVWREQEPLDRYLYPGMRVLVYLAYQALVLLVRLLSRAQQMLAPRVSQEPELLVQFQSRLMQALRLRVSQARERWDQLRLRAQQPSVSQELPEQQGLEASPQSQVTRLKPQWTRLLDLLERLRLMAMQMFQSQAWKQPVQRVALMFGDWLTTARRRIGQLLTTARRRIGQLLTIVKHQIGKR